MVATARGDVWVAAQAGRGWRDPQVGPDSSWVQPREHDVMLRLHRGRWARVATPVTRGPITHLTADGPNDIWAIADDSLLVHWNGHRWRHVATPNIHDALLSGLAALNPTDAWVVGTTLQPHRSHALIEHWNGTGWRRVTAPTFGRTTQMSAIAAASSADVWAFGTYISDNITGIHARSGIVTEHWNGRQWRLVAQPVYHRTRHRFFIHAAVMQSASNGWAVGSDRATSVVSLHWNGHRWRPLPMHGCCELLAAAAAGHDGIWTGGYSVNHATQGFQARVEQWTRTRWTAPSAPNVGVTTLNAISTAPDGSVYLAGTGANSNDTTYPILEALSRP